MSNIDVTKILVAIARLEEKYDSIDEDMKSVINKIDDCMKKNEECNQKNFKYMITTLLTTLAALFGWALFLRGVI